MLTGFESLMLIFILSLAIYCVAPLVIASVIKKPTTKFKYFFLCYLINFVGFLVLLFIFAGGAAFTGYVLWTGIFAAIGLGIIKQKKMLFNPDAPENTDVYYCYSCKGIVFQSQSKHAWPNCPNCGIPLIKSDVSQKEWEELSSEEKEAKMEAWLSGEGEYVPDDADFEDEPEEENK